MKDKINDSRDEYKSKENKTSKSTNNTRREGKNSNKDDDFMINSLILKSTNRSQLSHERKKNDQREEIEKDSYQTASFLAIIPVFI